MNNRNSILIVLGIITILVIGVYIYYSSDNDSLVNEGAVYYGENKIFVALADTPEERSQGLMFRESLPDGWGMLFIFNDEGIYSFWMKNVKFNLDMIWIDNSGIVVHIEKDVPTCSQICPSYSSNTRASYVLEVNSGVVDEIGLRKGSFVEIEIN